MKRSIGVICSCLAAGCGSSSALDLTPHIVSRIQNTRSFACPYFVDGNTRCAVNLPINTSVYGDGGEAHFTFADTEGATFVMKPSPRTPQAAFAGAELETYRKLAVSFAPKGTTAVVIRSEMPNSISRKGWSSFRFVVSSNFWGTRIMQSVTFVNFSPTQQILLLTTAGDEQFEYASHKSAEIINSWHSLSPGVELSDPVHP